MDQTYEAVAIFTQTWGLLYFAALIAGTFAWALWPSRRKTFEHAAMLPLTEDD